MRIFALGLVVVSSTWACGGPDKPPVEATPPAAAAAEPDGGALGTDPYASFDAGVEKQPDNQATTTPPPPSTDLSAVCQKAAAGWEKRARPAIKACYRQGKKDDPNLMGTARITVEVAYDGKPNPAKLDGISSLGDDVASCMVDAVTKTAFPEATECKSKQLTIPVEFPSKAK
jgi:hypothetical protein